MQGLIRWMLLIVGVGLTVQMARPHFRYGDWLDASSALEVLDVSIPLGMGPIMVLLHVGKVIMPAAAAMFWHRASYLCCALAVLFFPLLVAVSITSTLAFLDLQRGERAENATMGAKREADLRAELAATEARLKNIGWWRAVSVVEGEIAAHRRDPRWANTVGCSNATAPRQQVYCKVHDRLTGELAAAKEAEDDRSREKEIRAELLGLKATSSSAHPDLDFLARALQISLERVGFWRTVLFAAAIEAAEALFFLLATAPSNNAPQGRERRRILGARLLSMWRRALEWTKSRLPRRVKPTSQTPRHAEMEVSTEALHVRAAPNHAPLRNEEISRAGEKTCSSPQSDIRVGPGPRDGTTGMMPEAAVEAFVAECPRVPEARIPGAAMFAAYDALRKIRGWSRLSPAVFGRHLKLAIERAGGAKVKASAQIYVGLGLPVG